MPGFGSRRNDCRDTSSPGPAEGAVMAHHPIRLRNLIPSPVISVVVLALVVVFLAPATEQAPAAPPLSLTGFSPTAGPVGTVVTLTGPGFVSGDIVAIAGKAASSSTANSAGTKLTIRVPALATTGPITVQDPRTGQVVGLPGTLFRVTRGLYLSPSKVWPGGKTVLFGSGLTPDAVEKILLGTQLLTSVRTDAGGGFQAIISVPWDANTGFNRFGVLDRQGPIYVIVQILASWPAFRHDAAHSGYDSFETALTPSTVSGLKAKFNRGTFNSITSSPAVADNAVYVGSGDGNVYAWNATTGAALWTFNTGAAVDSSPTVSNGIVYVGSNNGQLYALNASTGVKIWSFTVGGPVDSPAVAYGFVYAASDFGHVFAVNATTGAKEWRFPAGSAVNSSPAVANGLLYVGSDSGKVFALDAGEGALVWSYQTGGVIESSPSVTSKALYIGSDDGKVYALNATTGSKLGSFATGFAE